MAVVWFLGFVAAASAQEIVTLPSRPNVTQSYFLASLPKDPLAAAVLFPGGAGLLNLRQEKGQIRFSPNNFVVRTRGDFVNRGVIAAIVDVPSDLSNGGMNDEFRLGEDHFKDISTVVADLAKRFPAVPIFLVGTSRGTVSAAALGGRFSSEIAGVVLTSTLFRQTKPGRGNKQTAPGLSQFNFGTIKPPLLFVHHVGDQCAVTPYGDAARLADKYPLISVSGGLPPQSGECDPLSAHGFFGKEAETVEEMVNWTLKKPFRQEVK